MEKQFLSMEALHEGKVFVGESPVHEGVDVYVKLVDGEVKYGYSLDRIGMIAPKKFFTIKNFVEYTKKVCLTNLGFELVMNESVLIHVKTKKECKQLMTAIENSMDLLWRSGSKPTGYIVTGHIQVNKDRPFSEDYVISYWSCLGEEGAKDSVIIDFDKFRKVMIKEN